jgi:hypothetical protein
VLLAWIFQTEIAEVLNREKSKTCKVDFWCGEWAFQKFEVSEEAEKIVAHFS